MTSLRRRLRGCCRTLVLLAALAACGSAVAGARLIVKFKEDAAKAFMAPQQRVERLAVETALQLRYARPMALGLVLVEVESAEADATTLATALTSHPDVDWAQADSKRYPARTANDEYLTGQTYLDNTPGGISAFGAWDFTTGSGRTVVGVVDTGYRPHADLAGRILPGYDMIGDPATANDGDGRDPDASDPGDWVSGADASTDRFKDCEQTNSSWHGTSVAGIIASNSDNGMWFAGIDWQARILPVRVLGKCGGATADVIDGIAWAAGLAVPGVPANPNPADVINLSLGGNEACSAGEAAVIAAALAAGHTRAIIAAAGNDSVDAAGHSPSNCPGVISVASTTTGGSLARYSNYGSTITLAAPGGQVPRNGLPGGILTLSNSGTTSPMLDAFHNGGGTSFAAPMVAGTAALALSVAPQLTAEQMRSVLVTTVKPFPSTSTCLTLGCGTGIVDARAAVQAASALAPPATTVGVVEFYNQGLDHYFITWRADEIAALDAGTTIKGWQRTGATFNVYPSAQPGSSPVCRYYMPPAFGDSHFFGRGTTECQQTGANNPGFILEASEFMDVILPTAGVCAAGTIPVYRVFSNRRDANHRYMVDRTLRDQMIARGWFAEGDGPDLVVMCSPQ